MASQPGQGLGWAWGAIQRAVGSRAGTADIWQAVRDAAAATGSAIPSNAFQVVNQLRGKAVQLRNAGQSFQQAGPETLLSPGLAPVGISARPTGDRNLLPQYKATFDVSFTDPEGNLSTKTLSMIDDWLETTTVGDVNSAVMDTISGLSMSENYGSGLYGGSDFVVSNVSVQEI